MRKSNPCGVQIYVYPAIFLKQGITKCAKLWFISNAALFISELIGKHQTSYQEKIYGYADEKRKE